MKLTEQIDNQNTNHLTQNIQFDDDAIVQLAAGLIKDDTHLSDPIKNQLADARQSAVHRLLAMQSQTQLAASNGVLQWLNAHITSSFAQHRAISAAFAMMLVTFLAIQQFGLNDNIESSDAYLLASDLPPEAFADKGFNTWIASAHN